MLKPLKDTEEARLNHQAEEHPDPFFTKITQCLKGMGVVRRKEASEADLRHEMSLILSQQGALVKKVQLTRQRLHD